MWLITALRGGLLEKFDLPEISYIIHFKATPLAGSSFGCNKAKCFNNMPKMGQTRLYEEPEVIRRINQRQFPPLQRRMRLISERGEKHFRKFTPFGNLAIVWLMTNCEFLPCMS
jgi:hypothetical protein